MGRRRGRKMKAKRISYTKYLDLGGSTNPDLYRVKCCDGEYRYYMYVYA
jgi:hypothetical protein